jgi:hypothetical protein
MFGIRERIDLASPAVVMQFPGSCIVNGMDPSVEVLVKMELSAKQEPRKS